MVNNKTKIEETALLVIDIVNMCCHPKYEVEAHGITFKKVRRMVPLLERFIDNYRKDGGNIVYVNCTPWTKDYLAKNVKELYRDTKCRYYKTDQTGFAEEFYLLKPEDGDPVFTKNTYDAFTNPGLAKYLKQNRIKRVMIAGIFGDGCVLSTIQGGFSAGFNLIILKDLIETSDEDIRQKLQALLKEYTWPIMFGKTIESKKIFELVQ